MTEQVKLKRVIFEAHNQTHAKVTAVRHDGAEDVVYLDNVSAKSFFRRALAEATGIPPMG